MRHPTALAQLGLSCALCQTLQEAVPSLLLPLPRRLMQAAVDADAAQRAASERAGPRSQHLDSEDILTKLGGAVAESLKQLLGRPLKPAAAADDDDGYQLLLQHALFHARSQPAPPPPTAPPPKAAPSMPWIGCPWLGCPWLGWIWLGCP